MDVMERIDSAVKENAVIIFMKGTPQLPQCGFSSRTSQVLMSYGVPFAYVNVIEDPEIFQNLPRYQNWPTFPQIYIKGELIGGHDIVAEMHENGELKTALDAVKTESEDT
ncbi:MAG: Grx4 family monothiol glutaredoxin [Methylococcaceae bacterium]